MKDENNGIFDEFDFMYRHKQILKEKEEQRLKHEREEKEAAEAAAKAAAASLTPEKKEPETKKPVKKKKKPAEKRPVQKKTAEKKEENKVHPKYGKPYKNDKDENRKRVSSEKKRNRSTKSVKSVPVPNAERGSAPL